MNLSQIGRFISQRRAALGLTQAQLAQRLDVTDKAVSKWERGKSLPDTALLSRVAAELRVSVVELLSGEAMNVARSGAICTRPMAGKGKPLRLRPSSCGGKPRRPFGFSLSFWQQFGAHPFLPVHAACPPRCCATGSLPGKPTAGDGLRDGVVPHRREPGGIYPGRPLHPPRGGLPHAAHRGVQFALQRLQSLPAWERRPALGQHGVAISQAERPYLFAMVVKTQGPVEFAVSIALTDRARERRLSPAHTVRRRRGRGLDPV